VTAGRALITGGAGFIGFHLARRLVADGAEVVLVDDLSRGRVDGELRGLLGHVRLVEHDLRQPVPEGLLGDGFQVVYHLAAVVGVDRSTRDPGHVLRTNVLSTLHLLDWCARTEPETVFLSSTSEVADGAVRLGLGALPVPEDVPYAIPDPRLSRSCYALSKMLAESALLHGAPGTRVRIARLFNVYGPRMGSAHVIPQLIERMLAGVDPFPLYGTSQTRSFCYVDDAVEAITRLVRAGGDEAIVANVGNDREEVTIGELAERIFALHRRPARVEVREPPPGSPERRRPDLGELRRLTGFEPRCGLDSGLRRTFEWYAGGRLT
jgi:nucleoside-diphosphate-sugar epimerase